MLPLLRHIDPHMKRKRQLIADLPSGIGVSKSRSGRGTLFYRVRLGSRFTGGNVLQKDFSSLEDARNWIFGEGQSRKASTGSMVALKEDAGNAAFKLSADQLSEAASAFKTCKGAGLSLTEAVKFAITHARPAAGSISITKAIEDALSEKQRSKRPAYVSDLKKRWTRFEKWLTADKRKAINGITSHDLRKFLNACKLAPVGEKNMLRNLSVLFSWAVKQHHMTSNPCVGMKVESTAKTKEAVRILSVEEAKKLLTLCKKGFHIEASQEEKTEWREKFGAVSLLVPPLDLIPIMSLGCFAGVRPEESARMTWEMIDFKKKHIDLPANITKDGNRRIVEMSANLLKLLTPCCKESGSLLPSNFRRKRWALCRVMGWIEWPEDILRHSYGSYHLALHKNAAFTSEQMGHRNSQMLYKHYREVVKNPSDIRKYWSLSL